MVSKEQILKASTPGDIFTNDFNKAKSEYKELVKIYHPDVYKFPDANDIFQKITLLYNEALKNIQNNTWTKSNFVKINKTNGRSIEITYLTSYPFELGMCYVCNKHIVYVFDKDKEKYKDNMISILKSINYRDKEMEKEFSRYIPKIVDTYQSTEGKHCIVIEKTIDVYPLKNVYEYYNNKLDGKHVSWIISRLSNIACFLKYNNIVHNGINIENCFISPEYHSILLLGGWWYAVKNQSKMIGTTKEIFDIMPTKYKLEKIANPITDLESVKLIGRKLLGSANCRILMNETTIPKTILQFLTKGSSDDAYKEFSEWDVALDKGYGVRKFTPFPVTKKQIYNL